jgi:hypothetical protein
LDRKQESKMPQPGSWTYSPWFPRTTTGDEPVGLLAEVPNDLRFEPRPDPDPDLAWDGYLVTEKDGNLIRYPARILRSQDPAATPVTEDDPDE